MIPTEIKILVFDIETSPMTAYVWGRHEVNIAMNHVKKESSVIAWGAKWLGDPPYKIIYRDQRGAKDIEDDRALLLPLWKLLNDADIVITYYGSAFDSPLLNARFMLHGFPPPKPYKHLDTYRIVKRVASFTSHKLEYLTDKLCTKYKKSGHARFPGMSLWTECLAGNKAAWDEMKKYNILDVLSTEELYNKIKAWTPSTMPNVSADATDCRVCGKGSKMWHKGFEIKKSGRYHRYQCQDCYAWTTGRKA
jgi:DNA polymerase elongation subunit (family B)